MTSPALPRGIRNKNPLNLRISNNNWLGKVAKNTDGVFEQFTSIEYGLRAAFRNIKTIVNRREKNKQKTTVAQLVNIWAPASDNNNELNYVRTIAVKTGIQPDDEVNLKDKNFAILLVYGMAIVENGQEVSLGRIESAYNLAFGSANSCGLQVQLPLGSDKK